MSLAWEHGAAGRLSKGRSIVPAGCAVASPMTPQSPGDKRAAINAAQRFTGVGNFSHKNRFPAGGGRYLPPLVRSVTTLLITVRVETLKQGA